MEKDPPRTKKLIEFLSREELDQALERLTSEQLGTYEDIQNSITDIISKGYPVNKVVELLGAEAYFRTLGRGQRLARIFAAKQFALERALLNTPLKLPDSAKVLATVIVPPDVGEMNQGDGTGRLEQKRLIHRTRYLMEVLADLGEIYTVIDGTNTANMMREKSYQAFLIPDRKKIVLVNNEEGNVTIIIHQVENPETQYMDFIQYTKIEFKALEDAGDTVSTVIYPGDPTAWKVLIKKLLLQDNAKTEGNDRPTIPAGWLAHGALATRLGMSDRTLHDVIAPYRNTHPHWIKEYSSTRLTYRTYDPALVAELIRERAARPLAPEGWINNKTLTHNLNAIPDVIIDDATVDKLADRYRAEHPDWFHYYIHPTQAREYEYYDPRLVAAIILEVTKRPVTAPIGWMTPKKIIDELKISRKRVNRFAARYRSTHPEWFEQYSDVFNHTWEYFSPELVRAITTDKQEKDAPTAPAGWLTQRQIAEKLVCAQATVKQYKERYRNSHPEWFGVYTLSAPPKREYEHYSPELVEQIRKDLSGS